MEIFLDTISSLSIGLLGILFFTLWRAKRFFIGGKKLSLRIFYKENIGSWIWASMVIVVTSVLISFVPEISVGISSFTGLEIATNKASFFTYGLGLSGLTGKKQRKTTEV
jgi:hypothetical protein